MTNSIEDIFKKNIKSKLGILEKQFDMAEKMGLEPDLLKEMRKKLDAEKRKIQDDSK